MYPDKPRNIVYDHPVLSGIPIIPSDTRFRHQEIPASERDPRTQANVSVLFPKIHAELMMLFSEQGTTRWRGRTSKMTRSDKVLDVYYHFLSILHLGNYEEPVVCYTPTGVSKQLWTKSGPNLQRVREAVDHMWNTTLIYEGPQPDPMNPERIVNRRTKYRILSSQSEPHTEVQQGEVNLSWVVYDPLFLRMLKHSLHVQIDVEIMSQLSGILSKTFYRVLSHLHANGQDRIEIPELFERVGSHATRTTPSDAVRMFGTAWRTLMQYRYLRSEPEIRRAQNGTWMMHFEWGDPVVLPHKADALYRAIVETGVTPDKAARMVTENARRAALVIQAHRAGALPDPKETLAQLIVGVYDDDRWDIKIPFIEAEPQMDLLDPRKEIRVDAPTPAEETTRTPTIERDDLLDWPKVMATDLGFEGLLNDVLPHILRAGGEASPERVLRIASVQERLQKVYGRLGWHHTLNALYHAAQYIHTAAKPANYLAHSLEQKADELFSGKAAPPAVILAPRMITPPETSPRNGSAPDTTTPSNASRPMFDLKALLRSDLEGWLQKLIETPSKTIAQGALRTVTDRRAQTPDPDADIRHLFDRIEQRANEILT